MLENAFKNKKSVYICTYIGVKMKQGIKRLVLDIDEQLHTAVKLHAVKRNITMRKYAMRAILRAIKEDERFESKT